MCMKYNLEIAYFGYVQHVNEFTLPIYIQLHVVVDFVFCWILVSMVN